MTRTDRAIWWAIGGAILLGLAGCGGGTTAQVGGAITGLGTGLTLIVQNNNADNLSITANGAFAFATDLASAATYSVTVLTQPAGQTCTVANGTGSIDGYADSVNSVAITCTTTASLGGTLTGLLPGAFVTLSNLGTTLAVTANGAFAFPGTINAGTTYNVSVYAQPAGQTCTITKPTGQIVANVESLITVNCN